tara:strand:- start:2223 stop:2369 length:147 start_codon:yes stop_codon:yes gene_type:complete
MGANKRKQRKCGMYYNVYIPWCFKNDKTDLLDEEDIKWYKEEYSKKNK